MTNHLHQGDLPAGVFDGVKAVAVDSETMGLRLGRDPLCVVQISGETASLVTAMKTGSDLRAAAFGSPVSAANVGCGPRK